jgi:hypothetical protein
MPDLDFAFLADHVRVDAEKLYVLGGAIDTVVTDQIPTAHPLGLAVRITATRNECGRAHVVEILVSGEDGEQVAGVRADFTPVWSEGHPAHWPVASTLALNIPIPLPRLGLYQVELLIDDVSKKTINLRVVGGGASGAP